MTSPLGWDSTPSCTVDELDYIPVYRPNFNANVRYILFMMTGADWPEEDHNLLVNMLDTHDPEEALAALLGISELNGCGNQAEAINALRMAFESGRLRE